MPSPAGPCQDAEEAISHVGLVPDGLNVMSVGNQWSRLTPR